MAEPKTHAQTRPRSGHRAQTQAGKPGQDLQAHHAVRAEKLRRGYAVVVVCIFVTVFRLHQGDACSCRP
jgi:hypothetical protein